MSNVFHIILDFLPSQICSKCNECIYINNADVYVFVSGHGVRWRTMENSSITATLLFQSLVSALRLAGWHKWLLHTKEIYLFIYKKTDTLFIRKCIWKCIVLYIYKNMWSHFILNVFNYYMLTIIFNIKCDREIL